LAPTFRKVWYPLVGLLLVLSYSLALGYHRVQSQLAWGTASTCSWYASPGLPWFLALVVGGALGLPRGRLLGAAVVLGLVASSLGGELVGLAATMIPCYAADAVWPVAFQRLAALQPPWLGTPTLCAALVSEFVLLAMLVLVLRDARLGRLGVAEAGIATAGSDPGRAVRRPARAATATVHA
jgi:hypothetical protein